MNRRLFLGTLGTVGAGGVLALVNSRIIAGEKNNAMTDSIEKLELSEAEWRQKLTSQQYDVLREESTERPFASPLDKEYSEGTYVCAGCDLSLFSSETKFDSKTGWPSFWAPIEGHTATRTDYRMILPRTEYHCVRCGGHQGHVFKDGPAPTGQRWCNNGVALNFLPA
jgi:peptide-methionine (R)-S-oxide reductase